MLQKVDSPPQNPFDHEDVSGMVKAGVVRMYKLPGFPQGAVATDGKFVVIRPQDLFGPFGVISQMSQDAIVFVE